MNALGRNNTVYINVGYRLYLAHGKPTEKTEVLIIMSHEIYIRQMDWEKHQLLHNYAKSYVSALRI